MRLLTYFLLSIFISSCTTIEVTKEVVKVGNVVKEKVEEKFEKEDKEIIEDKTIVEEQQIIIDKKEEEKTRLSQNENKKYRTGKPLEGPHVFPGATTQKN